MAVLELPDYLVKVRIAGAKTPREPVATTPGDPLAVSHHLELTGLAGRRDGFNVETLLDAGHETRDLGIVVLSRRAVNNFDLHLYSPFPDVPHGYSFAAAPAISSVRLASGSRPRPR